MSKVKKLKTLIQLFYGKKRKIRLRSARKKTLEQLRSGKPLFGKDGAFAPLLKDILEAAMEGELENHLDEEDRAASFEPQIVKKRETILAESLESKII